MGFFLLLPVLLLSIVVHEVAHALVAKWEGDDTADKLGRITLNPIPHMDLMGSLIVPVALYFLPGSFLFGWAKPVPVNPNNFRNYRMGDIKVSLAGIASNLILAALFTILIVATLKLPLPGALILRQMAGFGLYLNLILAVFNLIPIPPLDGSHVLYHLLPSAWGARYRAFGRYGITVLFLMIFAFPTGLRVLLWPVDVLMAAAQAFIQLWI